MFGTITENEMHFFFADFIKKLPIFLNIFCFETSYQILQLQSFKSLQSVGLIDARYLCGRKGILHGKDQITSALISDVYEIINALSDGSDRYKSQDINIRLHFKFICADMLCLKNLRAIICPYR